MSSSTTPNTKQESPKETMSRQAWHILSQQMTHAINCTEHKTSCVSFTELSHAELMAHIDAYVVDIVKAEVNKSLDELIKSSTEEIPMSSGDNIPFVRVSAIERVRKEINDAR